MRMQNEYNNLPTIIYNTRNGPIISYLQHVWQIIIIIIIIIIIVHFNWSFYKFRRFDKYLEHFEVFQNLC
jgi:ABC-type phosphate transport system permease subunit